MSGPAETALTMALVKLASEGARPRCGDWTENNPWLSEDARLRGMAARWCAGCVVLAECDAAAVENRERFGVWGGRDRTPRRKGG